MEFILNWEEYFKKFFGKETEKLGLKSCGLFVFREDGIPLYGNYEKLDRNSMGALMAGSWQAARALSNFIPKNGKDEIFRFSFDTSDRGIYILPFSIKKSSFIFGGIFHSEINPGQVKSRMRQILEKLLIEIDTVVEDITPKKEKFLFNEISDREMDKLFSFERD
jgi:hypothetical protein